MIEFRTLPNDHPDLAQLLVQTREEREGRHVHHVFETPLWRSALKLDTDDMLQPVKVQ
jgi:hypothetical protein